MNELDKMTFAVRNIDVGTWNIFKYFAGRKGNCANDQMLRLIDEFIKREQEE